MLAGIAILSVAAMRIARAYEISRAVVAMSLLCVGLLLYVVSAFLTHRYIRQRSPEFASDEMWELTAGIGIVPRWVSLIGIVGFSAIGAAVIPWLVAGGRALF